MIAEILERNKYGGQTKQDCLQNWIEYMTSPQTKKAQEKCIAIDTNNLLPICDPKKALASATAARTFAANAAAEMFATFKAAKKKATCEPFEHHCLSWSVAEAPSVEQMQDAARRYLTKMGLPLDQHQYVSAIHADTDNMHIHIAVNRVGTDKQLRSGSDDWNRNAAQQAVMEICVEMGFIPPPRTAQKFLVDNDKTVTPVDEKGEKTKYVTSKKKSIHNKEEDERFILNHGYESDTAKTRQALRAALPHLQNGMGWQKFAKTLAAHGVIPNKTKSGITYQVAGCKPIGASKLGYEVGLSNLKPVLTDHVHPSQLATATTLKQHVSAVLDTLHVGCGYPFFHTQLAARGIFADREGDGLIFSLWNGEKVEGEKINVNVHSVASRIGAVGTRGRSAFRSRGKEVSMPTVAGMDISGRAGTPPPPKGRAPEKVATPTSALAPTPVATPVATPKPTPVATPVTTPVATPVTMPVATQVSKPKPKPVSTPTPTPSPSQEAAQKKQEHNKQLATRRQLAVRVREIRAALVIFRKVQKKIMKEGGERDLKKELATLKKISSDYSPQAVTGLEEGDAAMSAIAIIISLILQLLQQFAAISKVIGKRATAQITDFLNTQLRRLYAAQTHREKYITTPTYKARQEATYKDIYRRHYRDITANGYFMAQGKIVDAIATRLRITGKTRLETMDILVAGRVPSQQAWSATAYAFSRWDRNYEKLLKKKLIYERLERQNRPPQWTEIDPNSDIVHTKHLQQQQQQQQKHEDKKDENRNIRKSKKRKGNKQNFNNLG